MAACGRGELAEAGGPQNRCISRRQGEPPCHSREYPPYPSDHEPLPNLFAPAIAYVRSGRAGGVLEYRMPVRPLLAGGYYITITQVVLSAADGHWAAIHGEFSTAPFFCVRRDLSSVPRDLGVLVSHAVPCSRHASVWEARVSKWRAVRLLVRRGGHANHVVGD